MTIPTSFGADKKILVTGATGFLGQTIFEHLPKHIPSNWDVAGIGSKIYDLRDKVECDIERTPESSCTRT